MWQKRFNVAVAILTGLLILCVLVPWIQHTRQQAFRTQSRNNLKALGLALHDYADVQKAFPPGGIFNHQRQGYHGWLTMLLPFMDSSPFYILVDFNEPWDSLSNAGLFLNDVQWYENPGEPQAHRHWEFPVADYSANPNLMWANSFVIRNEVKDTSNVFVVGELDGQFVPWACPYNWRELEGINSIPPAYGSAIRDGCQFLFVDGSVRLIGNDVSKEILRAMNGDDLSGFKANELNIQIPSTFPCPADALKLTWKSDDGDLILNRTDIHGKVTSTERRRGK